MTNIRINRYQISEKRIAIAKRIKAIYKAYGSELMALATPAEIAEAIDIYPEEEQLWSDSFTSYTMMPYEWENLKEILKRDLRHAEDNSKIEYVDDDGEHIMYSSNISDYSFIAVTTGGFVIYRGQFKDKAYRAMNDFADGATRLIHIKPQNKISLLAKKWQRIKELVG